MTFSKIVRWFTHVLKPSWTLKRHFSVSALQRIRAAVQTSEASHGGEIRVVIEARLPSSLILAGQTSRQRAVDLFTQHWVWDTELNNGVLIYLLLADRSVEVIADRGIQRIVGDAGWQAICVAMEPFFKNGQFELGVLHGVDQVGTLMQQHYPVRHDDQNELPDRPVLI